MRPPLPAADPVDQDSLIQILFLYMELKSELPAEQYEAIESGLCYGLSVCHATMAVIGKLEWWKDLLFTLNQWDGLEESLTQVVELQDSEAGQTLEQLFERAISYILSNHNLKKTQGIPGHSQATVLKPGEPLGFSVLVRNASGQFEEKSIVEKCNIPISTYQLEDMLANDDFIAACTNKIIIISGNNEHSCSLRYDQDEACWHYYEPNHPDGEQAVLDKGNLVEEVVASLGEGVILEVCTTEIGSLHLDADEFIDYDFLCHYLANDMLHALAPEILAKILARADETTLFRALNSNTESGILVLEYLLNKGPECIQQLFSVAERSDDLIERLIVTLGKANEHGEQLFRSLAKTFDEKAQFIFCKLFDLTSQNPELKQILYAELSKQNPPESGQSVLQQLEQHAPTLASDLKKSVATACDAGLVADTGLFRSRSATPLQTTPRGEEPPKPGA